MDGVELPSEPWLPESASACATQWPPRPGAESAAARRATQPGRALKQRVRIGKQASDDGSLFFCLFLIFLFKIFYFKV